MKATKAGERKKVSLAGSDKAREAYAKRSLATPKIIVAGIAPGRPVTIQPGRFTVLNVDERYQRVRITAFVNELIHVLKAGGDCPDPVSIAERVDGSLWIVDGQQRFWAHSECQLPLKALIYKVEDFDAERNLFLALNRNTAVNANTTVKAWNGPGASMIREASDKPGGPLANNVNMGKQWARTFDASILVKGMVAATAGYAFSGAIEKLLTRLDTAITTNQAAAERAQTFIRFVAEVFVGAGGRVRVLPMQALGIVAYQRWAGSRATLPDPTTLRRLQQINWDSVAGRTGWSSKFLPVFERMVDTRWPGGR